MGDPIARLSTALADRYLIERELGAGGMATVYLAHDIRHDRLVALKVLRPELASILGPERFLAEIKTTAHLQHPHILPLHDSGEAGGLVFYVMPYVEGESLRDRLNRERQLPVEEAVRIATEVAGALDYAHRHGVVHRDIKPENILLEEGQALVADFGIALAVHTAGAGTRITETGMSLGTPHYMAPEQAMGQKEITPKADVYALGCVLYEMLTGEPPFTGPTAQAIVARVMTEQPRALTLQRHTIPRHVEAAVLQALEKLPADRFASAGEFAAALANPSFTSAGATAAAAAPAPRRRDWRTRLAVPMTIVAAAMAAAAAWAYFRPAPTPLVRRYAVTLPEQQAPLPDRPFALSPDASHLAYVGPGDNGTQLWVKARERFDATPLTGTAGVYNFTFSPDGQWIAYVQNGQLKKLPIIGGAASTLADSVSPVPGLAWLDYGSLVYVQRGSHELRRIPDVGGPSTMVWRSDSTVALPTPLPGARGVLFTVCRSTCRTDFDVWVLDLRSGVARRLLAGAVMSWYVPTGHVIYMALDGAMLAVPFDARSLQVRGSPVPVLDNVSVIYPYGPLVAVSSEGTLVMRPGRADLGPLRYEMVWMDRAGRQTAVDSSWAFRNATNNANPGWSLSPDGTRLAIGLTTAAGDDIWIKQLPRGPLSRLSFDSGSEYRPRWSPDGRWVDYVGTRGGRSRIYRKRADGTGSEEPVVALPEDVFEVARTRDGQWLVTRAGGATAAVGRDILVQHVGVDSVPRRLLASPAFQESAAALSPDGRWIAYETTETGRNEVYVRPFPNVEAGKWQVSMNGGISPLWSRNGRELFFVDSARNLVAVPVAAGPAPRLGERRALFRLDDDIYVTVYYTVFDIAADGRFLMARVVRVGAAQVAPLIVVENWFEELKQKLGKR